MKPDLKSNCMGKNIHSKETDLCYSIMDIYAKELMIRTVLGYFRYFTVRIVMVYEVKK